MKQKILVIGRTHHNPLTMVRCLGMEGYDVDLIIYGDDDCYIRHSKYISSYRSMKDCAAVFQMLIACKHAWDSKPIVISSSDEVEAFFDMNYNHLKNYYYFFNAGEQGRVTHYMDKQVQVELAKKYGMKVPYSREIIASKMCIDFPVFPCIIKPLASISIKTGNKNLSICHTPQELYTALKRYLPEDKLQVQEFIIREYEIVVVGLSVGNEIIIPGFIKKIRDRTGGTTYGETFSNDHLPLKVINSIKQIIKEMHFEGLFGVELIYANNDYYLVEINLRNDATTYAFAIAGINLPKIYIMAKCGLDYHDEVSKKMRTIRSMVELIDFSHVLKRKVSLRSWLKQRNECECLYFYDANDIMPYKIAKRQYVLSLGKKILRRLHLFKGNVKF